MKDALTSSFQKTFTPVRGVCEVRGSPSSDHPKPARLAELEAQFSSPDWNYGKNPPFTFQAERRFPWGGLEIRLNVYHNMIEEAAAWSDALDTAPVEALPEVLRGTPFTKNAVAAKLATAFPNNTDFTSDTVTLLFEN
jgi:lipoate-protein ligase A